jgi:Putative prokaryotic signal transducing protein
MKRRGKVIPFPKRPEPAEPASPALVKVRRCRDQAEALVVRALLDGHGIPVVTRGQLVQSVHPFSVGDAGAVTLFVAAADADRARLLLAGV